MKARRLRYFTQAANRELQEARAEAERRATAVADLKAALETVSGELQIARASLDEVEASRDALSSEVRLLFMLGGTAVKVTLGAFPRGRRFVAQR